MDGFQVVSRPVIRRDDVTMDICGIHTLMWGYCCVSLRTQKLDYVKLSFNRKENKDDQLMAAQTYLKLGEVSAESGMSSVRKEICRRQTTEVHVRKLMSVASSCLPRAAPLV